MITAICVDSKVDITERIKQCVNKVPPLSTENKPSGLVSPEELLRYLNDTSCIYQVNESDQRYIHIRSQVMLAKNFRQERLADVRYMQLTNYIFCFFYNTEAFIRPLFHQMVISMACLDFRRLRRV